MAAKEDIMLILRTLNQHSERIMGQTFEMDKDAVGYKLMADDGRREVSYRLPAEKMVLFLDGMLQMMKEIERSNRNHRI